MSDTNKNNGPATEILVAGVVALLVGGTAPWWWQEFISERDDPPPPTPSPTPPTPSPTVPTPDPPKARKTSISVTYPGDSYACNLPISISVADQEFRPQGAFHQISDIELGQQKYRISGQINCLTIGSCQVFGEGIIDVVPNGIYAVLWQNTAFGQCSALLQANR